MRRRSGVRALGGLLIVVGTILAMSTLFFVSIISYPGGRPAPTPVPTPAFDDGAASENFIEECRKPIVFDRDVCTYVALAAMSAKGATATLMVPTTLEADPLETDSRAGTICNAIAHAHFDVDGEDLGYKAVDVYDREGGVAASCVVS